MAWIEAHQELRNHPKTKKAARLLGVSRPQMIGHLFCLWWWCLDYSANGNLAAFDNADIADGAEWDGDPDRFVQSLIECGPSDRPGFLVDNGAGLEVKDWCDYGGKYVTKRDQGRERQRNFRIKKRQSDASVTGSDASVTDSNALVTRHNSVSNAPIEEKSREEKSREEDSVGAVASKGVEAPPAAPPPSVSPPKARNAKQPKPPAEPKPTPPPAIEALRRIVGIYPPTETWQVLAAACTGRTEAQMRQTFAAWQMVTTNKHNWTWVTEWLPYGGRPPKNGVKPAPTSSPLTLEEEYECSTPDQRAEIDAIRAATGAPQIRGDSAAHPI